MLAGDRRRLDAHAGSTADVGATTLQSPTPRSGARAALPTGPPPHTGRVRRAHRLADFARTCRPVGPTSLDRQRRGRRTIPNGDHPSNVDRWQVCLVQSLCQADLDVVTVVLADCFSDGIGHWHSHLMDEVAAAGHEGMRAGDFP